MKKMTLQELKDYVLSEAKKLYQIEVLKEEKTFIENQLNILNECVPPTYDKDGNPDYIAGAPLMSPEVVKAIRQAMLKKAAGWAFPEPTQMISEKKYSDKASNFIGKEIGHLQNDKGYEHDRAVAAAINIAKDKGYKVPPAKNESSEFNPQMFFFKGEHDKGTVKLKVVADTEDQARKLIAKAEGAPESAFTFIKSEPLLK